MDLLRRVGLVALAGASLAGCDATGPSSPTSIEGAAGTSPAALRESLAELLREQDPYVRVQRLATWLPDLGPESTPEVKRVLQRRMAEMGVAEFELLMRSWASHDPAGATAWALSLNAPRFRSSAVGIAVERWAQNDPAAAVAGTTWAVYGLDRELTQATQLALVRGWFRKDRSGVESYIDGLGSGIHQQRALLAYALALADAEGSDSVIRWAEAVPDDDPRYKLALYRQVSTALAWADPEAARRWCDAQCDGPYGKSLRVAIARTWLHNEEDKAVILEWISRAPEGEDRDHALWTSFEIWALRDRDGALRWIEQKIAEGRDPWVRKLYGAYARQLAARSPAEAITWAERVEVESERQLLLIRIARRWRRQDADAAEAWLSRSSLPEKARAEARNLDLPDYLPKAAR